jgi:hypothetical protein
MCTETSTDLDLQIRQARPDDLAAINEIYNYYDVSILQRLLEVN